MSHDAWIRVVDAGQVLAGLREAGLAGPGLRSLTLDRAWPWRRHGLCALYVEGREGLGRSWAVLKPSPPALPRRLRGAAAGGGLRPLPAIDAFAMPLAEDPEIAAAAALDGARLAPALARWRAAREPIAGVTARPRSYKPLRRLTVEYRFAGGGRLYGKVLRRQDRPRVEQTCRILARSPIAAELALPAGAVDRWHLLVFDHRPGTELDRLIPGPAAGRGVELAGEALAMLHRCGVELPADHPRGREIQTLDRWLRCTVRSCPGTAERLEAARRKLIAAAVGLRWGGAVPGHRDFHPGQLLVAPRGITVLDLDTAAMAEPELDAGNFWAHLDLLRFVRRTRCTAELGARFRAAYERRAGRRLGSRRLHWYRAATLLRLACVYRFRPQGAILGARLVSQCLDLLDSSATSMEVV